MILTWIILIPFIGGLLSWQGERLSAELSRWIALASMALVFILAMSLWFEGAYSLQMASAQQGQWQLEYNFPWIRQLGVNFHLALDGLSLVMVILTGLIGVFAVACSWKEINQHTGFFYLNLLWSMSGVLGVFLAIDLFLFFVFWEVMLVPTYFLIALWGHRSADGKRDRFYAANKFFIFTQLGGLILLVSILALVFINYQHTGQISFAYDTLRETPLTFTAEYLLMLGFFIAFAIKLPIFPLHSWLPDAHAQAPTGGSVDLAGLLLKTAAYGLLRFSLPFFPHASAEFAPIAMCLGLVGIIYGAMMAFVQTDIKRLVAYTSVSHMGFVLIGIYSFTALALQGVIVQMVAHGISAAALFIICGIVYERLHTRDLREMGGLWGRMAYLPSISLFFAAASLGLPGLGNFVGEFLILLGAFKIAPWLTSFATGGLILASVYSLWMMQKTFYGPAKGEEGLRSLNPRELIILLSLMLILLVIGVYPQPLLNTSASTVSLLENALISVTQ